MQNTDDNIYLIRLLCGLNEVIYTTFLEQVLAHIK